MTSNCQGMSAEDRFNAVFKHLQNTHGPQSNLEDVQQLTDSMEWSKCLMEFNHRVTTLESTKQRDPVSGTVLRAERPAPRQVPHVPLTGDPAQDQAIHEAHYHATRGGRNKRKYCETGRKEDPNWTTSRLISCSSPRNCNGPHGSWECLSRK